MNSLKVFDKHERRKHELQTPGENDVLFYQVEIKNYQTFNKNDNYDRNNNNNNNVNNNQSNNYNYIMIIMPLNNLVMVDMYLMQQVVKEKNNAKD